MAALVGGAVFAIAMVAGAVSADPDSKGTELQFSDFQDKAFLEAKRSGSPVLLYFEADWCAPCKEMHSRTFRSPAVLEAAAGVRLFRVNMTSPTNYLELVKKSFRITGLPTVILYGSDGNEITRRFGFIPPDDLVTMLGKTAGKAPRVTESA